MYVRLNWVHNFEIKIILGKLNLYIYRHIQEIKYYNHRFWSWKILPVENEIKKKKIHYEHKYITIEVKL